MDEAVFKPYGPLAPCDEDAFAGRLGELGKIEEAIRARAVDAYIAILGPRQIGKTSLLHRVQATITNGWRIAMIDFQSIPGASQVECYAHIYDNIREQIRDTLGLWARMKRRPRISTHLEFCEGLRQLALNSRATKIVVLMDEIGVVGHDTAVALCRTVRYLFTNRQRQSNQAFTKYLFVFAGAWDLYQLSQRTSQEVSPLSNVVDFVYLCDLGEEETTGFLMRNLRRLGGQADLAIINYIYQITHGHPYLLQRIGSLVEKAVKEGNASDVTQATIDNAVEGILAHDKHLSSLVELLLEEDNHSDLVELYEIIQGREQRFSRTIPQIARLELMGLVRADEQGMCVCKNQIYSRMVLENAAIGQRLFVGQDYRVSAKLEVLLSRLDPHLIQMHEGAWKTLRTDNPERGRIAATQIRELLAQVLHYLAPNEQVLERPEYKSLEVKDISRKIRVRHILGGSQCSKTRLGVVESLAKLADEMYYALSGRAHLHQSVNVLESEMLVRITEEVITMILEESSERSENA